MVIYVIGDIDPRKLSTTLTGGDLNVVRRRSDLSEADLFILFGGGFRDLPLMNDFYIPRIPTDVLPNKYNTKKDFYLTPPENLPNPCEKRFYNQCERISVRPYQNKFRKRENRKMRIQKLRKNLS